VAAGRWPPAPRDTPGVQPSLRARAFPRLRYDRRPLRRFLVLALPAIVLAMALFRFAVEASGRAPALLSAAPELRQHPVLVILTWLLEAVALSALYLLVHASGGSRLLNGVLTGWIAWVFRGPLLVIAVVTLAGQPAAPWWGLTFSWWVLYTICGLLLGVVAAASGLRPGPVVGAPSGSSLPR
jgi:hypothetical protein